MSTFFITGISTEVGKTVAAAIITEALQADYWKPIQAGDLDNSDTHKVKRLVSNDISQYHDNAFALNTPMSPHASAKMDNITISANKIKRPKTKNSLVIEGAGGVLVPINDTETVAQLIAPTDKVIIVSRHYLGSINHTLMTVEVLKARKLNIAGILFSGDEHPTTEAIIAKMSQVPIIGRIDEEPYVDANVVSEYADRLREKLLSL
jgi:dethiobiotin synthetase